MTRPSQSERNRSSSPRDELGALLPASPCAAVRERGRATVVAAIGGLAVGALATALLGFASRPPRATVAPAATIGRAELLAALAPLEARLTELADRPLVATAERIATPVGPAEWPASVETTLAQLSAQVAALSTRLDASLLGAGSEESLERQLRGAAPGRNLPALERAWEELDRDAKAATASYALLGPRTLVERFGAPDEVSANGGKTWWYWHLDAERALGIAFASGLVCDMGTS